MKVNNRIIFWITIILFSIVVIWIRDIDTIVEKKYIFNREYREEWNIDKQSEKVFDRNIEADMNYIYYLSEENNNTRYKYKKVNVKFIDYISKKNEREENIILSRNFNIDYSDEDYLYSFDNFGIKLYSFNKKNECQYTFERFKSFRIISLDSKKEKVLSIGEFFDGKKYLTGFWILDIKSKKITNVHIVEKNDFDKSIENSLVYTGSFIKSEDKIVYYCDKYSCIYIFNTDGKFVSRLITNDNSPKPVIIKDDKGRYFYKRGDSFQTNNAVYQEKDNLYVISYRIPHFMGVIIDVYSVKNKEYKYSIKLKSDYIRNEDINYFYKRGNILFFIKDKKIVEILIKKTDT